MQLLRNQTVYYFQDRREERHIGECQGRKKEWHLVLTSQMYGLQEEKMIIGFYQIFGTGLKFRLMNMMAKTGLINMQMINER